MLTLPTRPIGYFSLLLLPPSIPAQLGAFIPKPQSETQGVR